MNTEPLGGSDLRISKVVFGAMARSGGTPEDRESLVRRAIDLGLTTIDTAPLYEFGDSERWVGRAIQGRRDRLVIATKVGLRWDDDHGDVLFSFTDRDGRVQSVRRDSRPSAIRNDVEGSLQRLGVDCLDLVQIHHPDRHVPIEDAIGALMNLRAEGKLRAVGVSNFDLAQSERARRALGDVGLACLQLPYSLLDRGIEARLLPWARRHGVSVLAYSPLAEGVLAKPPAFSRAAESWLHHAANAPAIGGFVERELQPVARDLSTTPATVALAWVRANTGVIPIIGASRPHQLEAAAAAARLDLSPATRARLDRASAELRPNRRAGRRVRDRVAARALGRARGLWLRLRGG
mgnify:CR=1 FL=1